MNRPHSLYHRNRNANKRTPAVTPLPAGSNADLLNFPYAFNTSGGAEVDIYIFGYGSANLALDYTGHASFLATLGARTPGQHLDGCDLSPTFNSSPYIFINFSADPPPSDGSHVSGTAAGSVFGVAKCASIIGIKCMHDNGAGAIADIISAINLTGNTAVSTGRPSVVSMSLGGAANKAIDGPVVKSVDLGRFKDKDHEPRLESFVESGR